MATANNTGTCASVSRPWVCAWYASSGNEATPHESTPTAATYRHSTRGNAWEARRTLPDAGPPAPAGTAESIDSYQIGSGTRHRSQNSSARTTIPGTASTANAVR